MNEEENEGKEKYKLEENDPTTCEKGQFLSKDWQQRLRKDNIMKNYIPFTVEDMYFANNVDLVHVLKSRGKNLKTWEKSFV